MKPSAKTAWRMPWDTVRRFAEFVISGDSATKAYRKALPHVAASTANTNGPALLKTPRVQQVIAHLRSALIENATEEFILNRDEIRRWHTLNAITPPELVDEKSMLAQRVTYITHHGKDGSVTEKKIVDMVSKSDSLKELAKLGGHYKPEKLEISDVSNLKDQAAEALASDPSFAEMLREEARNMAAARPVAGRIIDLPPLGSMTLEDREEAAELDAAAEALLDGD